MISPGLSFPTCKTEGIKYTWLKGFNLLECIWEDTTLKFACLLLHSPKNMVSYLLLPIMVSQCPSVAKLNIFSHDLTQLPEL